MASVASTLTAQPTLTLRPTSTSKPTRVPAATPTLQDISNRTDLLGLSFDYMISELEKIGFEFEIYDDTPGNRDAHGEYLLNKHFDVDIDEKGYSLVSLNYNYGYGSFLGEDVPSPDFDNIAKLIFTDEDYYEVVEPWFLSSLMNGDGISDHVLCFNGYVIWHTSYRELQSVSIRIMVENYYKEVIENYFGENPPFEQCQ